MWEKAAFLSFYASLCIAQRVAIANLGERQLNSSSQNSFSSTVGATRLPASSSQTPQSLLQASSQLTTRQAAASSVTVSNTATASNPTVVVVGLSSSAASQLGSSVQSFDPSVATTITFTPTTNTASFEVTSVSENFNTATAIPLSFPSNGVPQVPPSLVSEISQAEQQLNTPTNAAQVISSKLESINSAQASQASTGVSQMSVSLPAQDTATGSLFFSIPIPSIETAATSNPVSNGATTFPLPFPGTISSIPTASSVPSTVASTTNPSSILSTSSSITSSTTSSSSDTSSSSSSSTASSSSMSQSNSSATTLPGNSLKRTSPLSAGAIAGIVVGVAAALLIFGALLLWLLRRRSHQPVPQSPRVYPEEAYLYDPPIDPPPRAMSPARPGANSLAASPGFPPPEMSQAQAEREGLLGAGAGAGAAAGLGAVGVARHRRNMASDGREYAGDGRLVDPFADPPTQAEQERWPLNPGGQNGTLHPEDLDPGPGYVSGSSAGPSTRDGPGPSRDGGNGIGTAVSPSAYGGDEGGEAAVSGVGGLGGRSVGPHNHNIPGRYGPGGIMRGGDSGRLRTSGLSPTAGPSSAGVSPGLREARRAWGWES